MKEQKMKLLRLVFLIACAAILATVPVCWMFVRGPEFLVLEKRYRGKWPEFNAEMLSSGDWGKQVETWATDNMPARELLVGIDSYSQLFTGRQAAQKVILDKNGRLLEAPPLYSEKELERRLDKFIEFSELVNKEVLILIPPTAGYSSKAALPEHIWRCYNDDMLIEAVEERLERVSSAEGGSSGGGAAGDSSGGAAGDSSGGATGDSGNRVGLIDLREAFLAAKEPLFYRTDHHWNGMGAYTAYIAICEEFGLDPLPVEAFTKSTNKGFYGSNYAVSGLWLTQPDEIEMWAPPCDVLVSFTSLEAINTVVSAGSGADSGEVYDSMFFTKHLSERDQYPVFLDSNQPLTFIKNISRNASGTAPIELPALADAANIDAANIDAANIGAANIGAANIGADNIDADNSTVNTDEKILFIIKDSYANSLIPLLIPHFDLIVAVDLRYFRTAVTELIYEIDLPDHGSPILVVYSADHIVNDSNILWLR
ncbi:MAG: DHHW family protein [Oscillospiraceae bacterium]|nr:DHHW family protein [Oscillospiraceae bacterium]